VAMFQVKKESHSALKRYLSTSMLNETIKRHNAGEELKVQMDDGAVETFTVEWHAAGDLKTLKCCNGCSTGPAALCVCLFCMHQRQKAQVSAGGENATATARRRGRVWAGGLMTCRKEHEFGSAPTRDAQDEHGVYVNDDKWEPVLAIPLSRTHICTMHCENRVVEKLVHLHICKIWNMEKGADRDSRIKKVEHFLGGDVSEGGMGMLLRGEPFTVVQCPKLSGKYGSTPMKPSFNDVRARRFTAHASGRKGKKDEVGAHPIPY